MTPDDEAWEAFYVNPDAVTFTRAEVRAAFMAGRVSGRADAAARLERMRQRVIAARKDEQQLHAKMTQLLNGETISVSQLEDEIAIEAELEQLRAAVKEWQERAADAAAQALEDAADAFDHAANLYMEEIIRINDGLRLTGMHTIESARELVRHRLTEPAEELRERAAQYREKGNPDE